MAGSALRRLMAEYKQLTLNPPEGIIAGPINEENFFEWEALITTEVNELSNGLTGIKYFTEPNDESGANVDAAKMWREDRKQFNKIAEKLTQIRVSKPVSEAL
ncbi:Ubiquitin-conjugating enzyme E2 G2 [Papilio xuthus]|uniref:Ubiquitin-conjugating enzyme E2 G2 n=1 Tax=Papilio xuthus TaxID=66420 RepID=A0A194PEP0_PAPXU|nr:Ubiquitin-conjugating enzyme E2 G2 [Papilio xuthus]